MAVREEYFAGDKSFSDLQQTLLTHPDAGSVMPGCGGLRKLRWPDPRRGKGKRGGLRVIYLYVPEVQVILFLKVYDKDETDNLASSEQKELTLLAESLRDAARSRK